MKKVTILDIRDFEFGRKLALTKSGLTIKICKEAACFADANEHAGYMLTLIGEDDNNIVCRVIDDIKNIGDNLQSFDDRLRDLENHVSSMKDGDMYHSQADRIGCMITEEIQRSIAPPSEVDIQKAAEKATLAILEQYGILDTDIDLGDDRSGYVKEEDHIVGDVDEFASAKAILESQDKAKHEKSQASLQAGEKPLKERLQEARNRSNKAEKRLRKSKVSTSGTVPVNPTMGSQQQGDTNENNK